ncbi:MAG: hypothetical protein R3D85_11630 [Paracoccaceae bacterium]
MNQTLDGGDGNDTLTAEGAGGSAILGGAGDDVIQAYDMIGGSVNGGAGVDLILLNGTTTVAHDDPSQLAEDYYFITGPHF